MVDDEITEMKKINKIKKFNKILASHQCCAECGTVIIMDTLELSEEENICMMRTPFVYEVLMNIDNICETMNSKTFQIEFTTDHIDTGNSFLLFVAPYFEHLFEVIRFVDKEENNNNDKFTNLSENVIGKWLIVENFFVKVL